MLHVKSAKAKPKARGQSKRVGMKKANGPRKRENAAPIAPKAMQVFTDDEIRERARKVFQGDDSGLRSSVEITFLYATFRRKYVR